LALVSATEGTPKLIKGIVRRNKVDAVKDALTK
jgi:hypothetical protein